MSRGLVGDVLHDVLGGPDRRYRRGWAGRWDDCDRYRDDDCGRRLKRSCGCGCGGRGCHRCGC